MTEVSIDPILFLWPEHYKAETTRRCQSDTHMPDGLKAYYGESFNQPALLLPNLVAGVNLPLVKATDTSRSIAPTVKDLPLTIVTVTRNDTHVERMEERTQAFIDCVYWLAEQSQTKVELIIVEWNPPHDRAPMAEAFRYPENHPFVSTLIITIPHDIHTRFEHAQRLPLYQMIGKNVGIRRARGRYVVATNIDVLLSQNLFSRITAPDLEQDVLYRSNRWDVDRSILDLPTPEAMLAQAEALMLRVNYRESFSPSSRSTRQQDDETTEFAEQALWYPDLHTQGCGDFQMMHRDSWHKVRGYTEIDAFSWHLDSLLSHTCYFSGMKEIAMSDDYPHFHVDHSVGVATQDNTYVTEKLGGLRHVSMENILLLCGMMHNNKDAFVVNHENWGMAGLTLPTTHITKASWEEVTPNYQVMKDSFPSSLISLGNLPTIQDNVTGDIVNRLKTLTVKFLQQTSKGRPLYIWGAGVRGIYHAGWMVNQGFEIAGLITNDLATAHPFAETYGLINQSEVAKLLASGAYIAVASTAATAIGVELHKLGAVEGTDFVLLF